MLWWRRLLTSTWHAYLRGHPNKNISIERQLWGHLISGVGPANRHAFARYWSRYYDVWRPVPYLTAFFSQKVDIHFKITILINHPAPILQGWVDPRIGKEEFYHCLQLGTPTPRMTCFFLLSCVWTSGGRFERAIISER